MDIIATNTEKIIKIFTDEEDILISVFHIYENDKKILVRIYKMNSADFKGFIFLVQPRLLFHENYILVCLLALDENSDYRTGYFFVNFLKSFSVDLSSNVTNIEDLVSMENNLYSLNLKIKILDILSDFIFINSKYQKINVEDELDETDKLILRQYRKDAEYKVKFRGLAIGDEGEEKYITINLNECLEGFSPSMIDPNICIFIENNETHCQFPCKECNGPIIDVNNMNCISCVEGFNITEDTNSCNNYLPSQYYLDDNIFRRCHSNCNRCTTKPTENNMNCLDCISSEYDFSGGNCYLHIEKSKSSKNVIIIVIFIILIILIIIAAILIWYYLRKRQEKEENEKELISLKASSKVSIKSDQIIPLKDRDKSHIQNNKISNELNINKDNKKTLNIKDDQAPSNSIN